MEPKELITKISEIEKLLPSDGTKWSSYSCQSFFITTIQFVKNYIGQDTEFYKNLEGTYQDKSHNAEAKRAWVAKEVLNSVKDYLNLSLEVNRTEKYNLKVDVISDFMLQAIKLVNDKSFHPAAAAILMGATLEEFLKKLSEEKSIDLENVNKTIDPIAKKLYEKEIITKQDLKDITSWAGIRNDATHGNFEEVNDRKRISNAIEGLNLFMRKYADS